jgi:hypothetical protein
MCKGKKKEKEEGRDEEEGERREKEEEEEEKKRYHLKESQGWNKMFVLETHNFVRHVEGGAI